MPAAAERLEVHLPPLHGFTRSPSKACEPSWSRSDTGSTGGRSWTDRVPLAQATPIRNRCARDLLHRGAGLLVIETDARASVTDAAVQDVTARLMAERFESVSVWCATTERPEYAGGQAAEPPAPGVDPPAWYS